MGGILPAYRVDSSWRESCSTQPFRSSRKVRQYSWPPAPTRRPLHRAIAAWLRHRTTLRPSSRSPGALPPKPGTDPAIANRRVRSSGFGSPSLFASRSPAWHVTAASMGARAASRLTAQVPCRFRVPFLLLGRWTRRSTAVRHRALPLLRTPMVRRRNRLSRAAARLPIRARRSRSIGMRSVTWLWWIAMCRRKDSEERIADLAGETSGKAYCSREE